MYSLYPPPSAKEISHPLMLQNAFAAPFFFRPPSLLSRRRMQSSKAAPVRMPSLWKKPVEKGVLSVLGALARSRKSAVTVTGIDESKVEATRFVAAFCGTGTGHFTQTLAVIKILQSAGLTLAAVITVRCALGRRVG